MIDVIIPVYKGLAQTRRCLESVFANTQRTPQTKNINTHPRQAGKSYEKQTLMAAAGKANITDVVTAVSSAEVTLQAVTAVRDRVISAYQVIMRMPI